MKKIKWLILSLVLIVACSFCNATSLFDFSSVNADAVTVNEITSENDIYFIVDGTTMAYSTLKSGWDKYRSSTILISLSDQETLDFNNINLFPLGNEDEPFVGTFNGNGYSMANFTLNGSNLSHVGFFAYSSGATFENICVEGDVSFINVDDATDIGILTGYANNCTFSNIQISSNVSINTEITGTKNIGLLAGTITNASTVSDCVLTPITHSRADYSCEINLSLGSNLLSAMVGSIAGQLTSLSKVYRVISIVSFIIDCKNLTTGNFYQGGVVGAVIGEGCEVKNCLSEITTAFDSADENMNILSGGLFGLVQYANSNLSCDYTKSDLACGKVLNSSNYNEDGSDVYSVKSNAIFDLGNLNAEQEGINKDDLVLWFDFDTTFSNVTSGGVTLPVLQCTLYFEIGYDQALFNESGLIEENSIKVSATYRYEEVTTISFSISSENYKYYRPNILYYRLATLSESSQISISSDNWVSEGETTKVNKLSDYLNLKEERTEKTCKYTLSIENNALTANYKLDKSTTSDNYMIYYFGFENVTYNLAIVSRLQNSNDEDITDTTSEYFGSSKAMDSVGNSIRRMIYGSVITITAQPSTYYALSPNQFRLLNQDGSLTSFAQDTGSTYTFTFGKDELLNADNAITYDNVENYIVIYAYFMDAYKSFTFKFDESICQVRVGADTEDSNVTSMESFKLGESSYNVYIRVNKNFDFDVKGLLSTIRKAYELNDDENIEIFNYEAGDDMDVQVYNFVLDATALKNDSTTVELMFSDNRITSKWWFYLIIAVISLLVVGGIVWVSIYVYLNKGYGKNNAKVTRVKKEKIKIDKLF